jgi:hypothetical protein
MERKEDNSVEYKNKPNAVLNDGDIASFYQ